MIDASEQTSWQRISRLGIEHNMTHTEQKRTMLSNQLSIIIGGVFLLIALIQLYSFHAQGRPLDFNIYRLLVLIPILLLNPLFNYFKWQQLSRLNLSVTIPAFILFLPAATGNIPDGDLYWYPYVSSVAALLPQLLLDRDRNKLVYWLMMSLLLLFSGTVIEIASLTPQKNSLPSIEVLKKSQVIYRVAPIAIYLFIYFTLSYQKRLAEHYQKRLLRAKKSLERQGKTIKSQNEELQTQNEELSQQHEEILSQQEFLREKSLALEASNSLVQQSIHAASQIQEASVPKPGLFKKHFAQHAILHQKAEAISSSAYWLNSPHEQYSILVVKDLQISGVSGALMTMGAISKLGEITNLQLQQEPKAHHILEELLASLRSSLEDRKLYNRVNAGVWLWNRKSEQISWVANNIFCIAISDQHAEWLGNNTDILSREIAKQRFYIFTPPLVSQLNKNAQQQLLQKLQQSNDLSLKETLLQSETFMAQTGSAPITADFLAIGIETGQTSSPSKGL